MARLASILIGFVITSVATAAESSPADFTGVWTMDPSRSESAHQDVPIGPVTLTIKQTADAITIETVRKTSKQSPAFQESLTYKLDGSESTNVGNGRATVTTKAHWQDATLVAETIRNVENSTVTTSYLHSLAADGRELVIEKTLHVQHGYQFLDAKNTGRGRDVFVKKSR